VNVTNTVLDAGTDTRLRGTALALLAGYSFEQTESRAVGFIGGLRYLDIEATTHWQLAATVAGPDGEQTFPRMGSIDKSDRRWDAVVGTRGRLGVGAGIGSCPTTSMSAAETQS
jgi:hypothetical protein